MSSQQWESCRIAVIKLGGSVLTDAAAYRRAAEYLRWRARKAPHMRFVAVVSAERGATDALLAAARRAIAWPNPVMLDLLWSTGELRSVALLTLHLHAAGVRATGLNVHQTGLVMESAPGGVADAVKFESRRLLRALERFRVVVTPGFLAARRGGGIVSLGRGGSDLSAVLLAAGLRAASCELVKDVPGYFSADPAVEAEAEQLPRISLDRARTMARSGCHLVQPAALEIAARHQVRLVVCSLEPSAPKTEIFPELPREGTATHSASRPAAHSAVIPNEVTSICERKTP